MNELAPFEASLKRGTTNPAPLITPYLPERTGFGGLSLIIFPGGGYQGRAEHEGHGLAAFFRAEGIACFVVDYRLAPNRHPAMLEDALAAVETVRGRAVELGVDPEKVGLLGSSAGGHLAAHASVAWPDYGTRETLRPAFTVLCYPVIYLSGKHCHGGSGRNLLGENPSAGLLAETSVLDRVDGDTPVSFVWLTGADQAVPVENSLHWVTRLREHGVPFELHVYQRGGHGLGRNTALGWPQDCLRWLAERAEGRHS